MNFKTDFDFWLGVYVCVCVGGKQAHMCMKDGGKSNL